MHLEIQVALNFVISYLYNKLPRRRVNIFGEELEKALRLKFDGHWYPEKPFKGSAYRCIKTGNPMDNVFERAAKESGMDLQDIRENLPEDLAIWVDPGEVSYRIGEKSSVRILFSEKSELSDESLDREVTKTFNPEAQTFLPIDCVSNSFGNLTISPSQSVSAVIQSSKSPSPVPFMPPKSSAPLTFTTASFAQTKFGSTKLKSNTKRPNRMSPTEFSHYIKQRAMLQQLGASYSGLQRPRSLSPIAPLPTDPVMNPFHSPYSNPCYISDLVNCAPSPSHHGKFNSSYMEPMFGGPDCSTPSASPGTPPSGKYPDNLGMGNVSYSTNQYHHLLVAN